MSSLNHGRISLKESHSLGTTLNRRRLKVVKIAAFKLVGYATAYLRLSTGRGC